MRVTISSAVSRNTIVKYLLHFIVNANVLLREAGFERELSDFDIKAIEEEILDQVDEFIPRGEQALDLSILTQLQHYDSQTNLIDFTTDF